MPIAALAVVAAAVLARAEAPNPGQPGVVVLRNGRVIHGRIRHDENRYIVSIGTAGEIRLPSSDVELVCRDLPDAYVHRRASLDEESVGARLDLAEWCLQNRLLSQAGEQLRAATALDPNGRRVRLLENRLRLAARRNPPTENARKLADSIRPSADAQRPTMSVSSVAVESFARTIQPILLNGCAAARCHGSGTKSGFRLTRSAWGGSPPQRITQQNLDAALRFVDREQPSRSPLLTAPLVPHGTASGAIFTGRRQRQHAKLVQWVGLLANSDKQPRPATVRQPEVHLSQADGTTSDHKPSSGEGAIGASAPLSKSATARPPIQEPQRPRPSGFVPKDPFDPEIFNRRYFSDRSPSRNTDERESSPDKPFP